MFRPSEQQTSARRSHPGRAGTSSSLRRQQRGDGGLRARMRVHGAPRVQQRPPFTVHDTPDVRPTSSCTSGAENQVAPRRRVRASAALACARPCPVTAKADFEPPVGSCGFLWLPATPFPPYSRASWRRCSLWQPCRAQPSERRPPAESSGSCAVRRRRRRAARRFLQRRWWSWSSRALCLCVRERPGNEGTEPAAQPDPDPARQRAGLGMKLLERSLPIAPHEASGARGRGAWGASAISVVEAD